MTYISNVTITIHQELWQSCFYDRIIIFLSICHVYSLSSALELGRREFGGSAVSPPPSVVSYLKSQEQEEEEAQLYLLSLMKTIPCQLSALKSNLEYLQ